MNTDKRTGELEAQATELDREQHALPHLPTMTSMGIDVGQIVQSVIDIGVQLVKAKFGAFFYKTTDDGGQHMMLYALNGAPRDAFSGFPIPGRTELFSATFEGTQIVRSDDILQDPRYGKSPPHYGMPKGHLPVRSYLAAPVIAGSGEVLGGLFFGHPEPGRFEPSTESVVGGVAQLAAIALENARLLLTVQHSERRFKAMLENSSEGIAIVDDSMVVSYVSPGVATMEGYAVEEITGTNAADRMHPDDLPKLQETFGRLLANPGERQTIVLRRRHKNGQWLWLEAVATNLLHDPAVRGVVSNFRDITERKRAEEALMRSQKMEALGTLAGGIAHDFNNLLLAIAGNTKLALEDLEPGHASTRSLHEIGKAAKRATDLVARILAFSRQQETKRAVVDLIPIVEDALKLLRATLPAMIEIKCSSSSGVPHVFADSSQIHQVIMNLVTNAAHAIGSERGIIEVRIEPVSIGSDSPVRELAAGAYARITVGDNGSGMSAETISRIFDPFFTTKPSGQGTGLGLSVVHGIVKAHDGAIAVYSQPDKGSSFAVYLPAALADHDARPADSEAARAGTGERILYIDDDSAIVFLTGRILERLGYRVTGCDGPKVGLDTFRAAPEDFDVVVTDLSMPGMSGFDVARELHSLRPTLPILMTSGYVRPEDRERAQACGIRDVIYKPNSVEELGQALDRLFRAMRS